MATRWINLSSDEIDILKDKLVNSWNKKEISLYKKLEKSQKTITVSSRKGKGRNLQQWVCERISELTGIPYSQDDDSLIRSREMGQAGVDIILRGEAKELFPFAIECKSTETISLRQFVDQAKANVKEGTDWLVILRTKSIPETMAIMSWETFEKIYKRSR